MHHSFVERGANGGLAGSDVRVLDTSPRQCTVIGINNHEIPGLDIVQCAALVNTNHGNVNLIMNEYAYYGKGHTIHSSGQIEWHTNTVDDKSVQVGGQERIITIDGYSMPLMCKGGLMHLIFQGIPIERISRYILLFTSLVLKNGIHLYLIMYTQRTMGSLTQFMIQLRNFKLIQHLMNLMIISKNYYQLHPKFHQLMTYWLMNIPLNGE